MARLDIKNLNGKALVTMTGVPMPDGNMRDYADFGRAGLTRIIERVRLDKKLCLEKLTARRAA